MINKLKIAFGYRKFGCYDKPEEIGAGTKLVKKEQIESSHKIGNIPMGMISTETKDQKNTARCTAHAIAKVIEIMATRRLKKMVYIDPVEIWNHQLQHGASERDGDSLQNAVRQVVKNGVTFNDYDPAIRKQCLRHIGFEGFVRIKPEDFSKWLKDKHPIYTGLTVYEDFTKNDVVVFTGKSRGGHAIPIIAEGNSYFRIENSWGDKWGIDGTCLLRKEDTNKLMSAYVMTGMSIS